jgi:hypothetical protein
VITLLDDSTRKVSALLHRRRVAIDPQYRGECEWLFENERARRTFYGRKGLTVDQVGEALYDAQLVAQRPNCNDVLELLGELFRPAETRAVGCTRREAVEILGAHMEDLDRQIAVRLGNRWRSYRCQCKRPIRVASDNFRGTCSDCGETFVLVTIKLDLSNVIVPASVDDVTPF